MKESQSIHDVYEVLHQIGRGSYASVYKAINKQTGELCAIKKIPSDASELNNLITEIGIISKSKCENIVRFLTSEYTNKEVNIVMEYCCGGSVKDVMRQLGRTINQEQITVILKGVLNGLAYLHASNKIHRDVKAANILLNQDGIAKLGDFGVSEPLDTANRKRTIIGTPLWLPPEVINQDPNYSTAIDIWSLGVTIIEMGDGEPPYKDLEPNDALKEISNLDKPAPTFKSPSLWSQELQDFLSLCLEKDASKRKPAEELLNCDIIKKAPSNSVIKSLVDEVCSVSHRAEHQLESSLCKGFESLLNEVQILFRIYKERRLKVIRVDQMTGCLNAVHKEFKDLEDKMLSRNSGIRDAKNQLENHVKENEKLQKDLNDLKATLESCKKKRMDFISFIEQVKRNKFN